MAFVTMSPWETMLLYSKISLKKRLVTVSKETYYRNDVVIQQNIITWGKYDYYPLTPLQFFFFGQVFSLYSGILSLYSGILGKIALPGK